MCEVLKYWLATAFDPPPTWEAVVTALRSRTVNENYIADHLESKYCAQVQHMGEEFSSHTKMKEKKGSVITSIRITGGLCKDQLLSLVI